MNPKAQSNDDAIRRYESFIELDPDNPLLWIKLGDLYHEAGRTDESLACFEKALLNDPGNQVAKGRIGNVLITQHRFAEAEKVYREVIDAGDQDPVLLHNYGLSLIYQRRSEDALAVFRRAEAAGLTSTRNLAYITYSLHQTGQLVEAIESAKRWLQLEPTPATEGYLALLEMDAEQMDAAHARARSVLQRDPNNADAAVVEGIWSIEQEDVDRAQNHFEVVTHEEPNNPRGWQGLGLTSMYHGRHAQAIQLLERAIEHHPDDVGTMVLIGWAHITNQDPIRSEQAFRRAIDTDRNLGEAHGGLACALVFQNRIDEANVEIKRATGLDPTGFGAVYARSIILQMQGHPERGQKLLARLLQQRPGDRGKPLIEYIDNYYRRKIARQLPQQQAGPKSQT